MTKTIEFGGKTYSLAGKQIKQGRMGPDFRAVAQDFSPFDFHAATKGKIKIISSVPSLDTSVCSLQTQHFNEEAGRHLEDLVVVTVSVDLPFAQKRFCGAEGIENVVVVSDHRDLSFGKAYGFVIEELRLLARGVVVLDRDNTVRHVELVTHTGREPDYEKALSEVRRMLYDETLDAVEKMLHED